MAKYDPLQRHLEGTRARRVELTFAQVERILGDKLPESAWKHRAWWSNGTGPKGPHVEARAWLDAGFRVVELDQEMGKVVFERSTDA